MRAILSVSDKTGLVDFARGLVGLGVELISTGGTAKAIGTAGLPVVNVSDVTRFPEMMDGRVKTLHPAISTAASWRAGTAPTTSRRFARSGIQPIDLVVVNLYPFGKAADNPERRSTRWSRRSTSAVPACCARPRRTSATCWSSSHPEDYPRCSRSSREAEDRRSTSGSS